MNKRKSFTLIELLVVIAIIAILAGMLLPTLQQAKGRAVDISCMSRFKNIAQADGMYQQDYEFFCPSAATSSTGTFFGGYRYSSSSGGNDFTQEGYLTPYLKRQEGTDETVASSALAQKNSFFCTDSKFLALITSLGATASASYGSGIGANPFVHGYGLVTAAPLIRPGKIANPSGIVSFADQIGGGPGVFDATSTSSVAWIFVTNGNTAFRHNGKANVAWADGHVSAEQPGFIFSTVDGAEEWGLGGLGAEAGTTFSSHAIVYAVGAANGIFDESYLGILGDDRAYNPYSIYED